MKTDKKGFSLFLAVVLVALVLKAVSLVFADLVQPIEYLFKRIGDGY